MKVEYDEQLADLRRVSSSRILHSRRSSNPSSASKQRTVHGSAGQALPLSVGPPQTQSTLHLAPGAGRPLFHGVRTPPLSSHQPRPNRRNHSKSTISSISFHLVHFAPNRTNQIVQSNQTSLTRQDSGVRAELRAALVGVSGTVVQRSLQVGDLFGPGSTALPLPLPVIDIVDSSSSSSTSASSSSSSSSSTIVSQSLKSTHLREQSPLYLLRRPHRYRRPSSTRQPPLDSPLVPSTINHQVINSQLTGTRTGLPTTLVDSPKGSKKLTLCS